MEMLISSLEKLLATADLDNALEELSPLNPAAAKIPRAGLSGPERISFACMKSDVLDYGSFYEEAQKEIAPYFEDAKTQIVALLQRGWPFRPTLSQDEADSLNAKCWVLIHYGMSVYRHANSAPSEYAKAKELFEKSRDVWDRLHQAGFPHLGGKARAWYCLGLVHRELYQYTDARSAFAQSIEIGSQALLEESDPTHEGGYRYLLSRCYGLGTAWVSYNEASLAEAKCHVVAARLLLAGARARYINADIELLHASILLSAQSDNRSEVQKAIGMLQKSYAELGGDEAFQTPILRSSAGHRLYALRVANRLALAHLRFAKLSLGQARDHHLKVALSFTAKVKESEYARRMDQKTYCNSFIIESRIHREARAYKESLASAMKAHEVGESMDFSRIDCLITLGEARYFCEEYGEAVEAFTQALQYGHANRKIFAVCHLHLSRTYLRWKQPAKASFHFEAWKETGRGLENAFIRGLVAEIENQLGQLSKGFNIPEDTPDLSSKLHIAALRHWLASVALVRAKDNYKAAAGFLAVQSETTIKNWLEDKPAPTEASAPEKTSKTR